MGTAVPPAPAAADQIDARYIGRVLVYVDATGRRRTPCRVVRTAGLMWMVEWSSGNKSEVSTRRLFRATEAEVAGFAKGVARG